MNTNESNQILVMLTAMVERALLDLFAKSSTRSERDEAKRWINSNSLDEIFNFRSVCEWLDVCPDKLRAKVREKESENFITPGWSRLPDNYVFAWFAGGCGEVKEPVINLRDINETFKRNIRCNQAN